jgi:hypothetical protein
VPIYAMLNGSIDENVKTESIHIYRDSNPETIDVDCYSENIAIKIKSITCVYDAWVGYSYIMIEGKTLLVDIGFNDIITLMQEPET